MSPQQQLEALINTFEPRIRDAFLRAIAGVVDNTILQQVIDAIVAGDPQKAFDALGMDEAALHPLAMEIQDAFERAGNTKADGMPRGPGPFFRFNMRNTRAEQWLREKSSQLITTITEDARINVMNTIEAGVRDGRNPRSIALDIVGHKDMGTGKRIGGIVGLNQNQEGWVRSAKNKLGARFGEDGVYTAPSPDYFELDLRDKRFDGTVQAAIDAGKPLSQETVDNLVTRYKSNALRHRGEMIARHEAIEALNHAEWESTKQAVERGKVKASAVTREWDSAGDKRVRLSHALMDGQQVGLDEPFVSPVTGAQLMFPGDTSLGASAGETAGCRCRVKTIIDFFAK